MKPRERIAYSAIADRDRLELPDGARLVVWPIVNVENWEIEKPMARTVLPPPGGTAVVPDLPNWAWHEYGMRVGFWRLKAALDRFGIKATLSINASVCEVCPRLAGAARDAGWEFMAHSFIQTPMGLLEDQRAAIRETIDAIEAFTGAKPRGWLGPGLTETLETPDILAEEGIEYVADWVLDDQPVDIRTSAGTVVSVPYTVETNDITMMALQQHSSDEMLKRATDQFDRLYKESETITRIMAISLHPYITGAPHRIRYLEELYRHILDRPDVLIWTGAEIADWYRGEIAKAGG